MDKKFWIGFNLVKGIGAVRMRALMSYFDSLEEVLVILKPTPRAPMDRK